MPRAKSDRTVISFRIDNTLLEAVDADAVRFGMNRTDCINLLLASSVGRRAPRSEPETVVVDGDCPHPKDKMKVYGWGKVCGQCGSLVR